MNQRRREISKAYQEILSSRMNQRRQDILRAYHQMVLAQVPEAHIRLAFEEGDLENLQEDIMKASTKSGSISSIELHVQETRAEREDRVRVGIASRVVAHRDQVEGALFDVADRAGASSLVGARQERSERNSSTTKLDLSVC